MLQKSTFQKLKNKVRKWIRHAISPPRYANVAAKLNYCIAGITQLRVQKPLSYPVECMQPLIYISEPPRSGGTLMRSLLDGHKQLHVFPHELSFDKKEIYWAFEGFADLPTKNIFRSLRDEWTDHFFTNGIDRLYPFYFNRRIQWKFFKQMLPNIEKRNGRAIADAYISSFFNAWIDYQGLYGYDKRYKTAFCPWPVNIKEADIRRFFDVYPEGYRIHVVRDPFSWWASYRTFHREKEFGALPIDGNFDKIWLNNCNLAKKLGAEMPDRYIVVLFEDLLREPQRVMCDLAERVGIDFHPCMLEPAINNIPKKSNSTHSSGKFGFDAKVLERWKTILPETEVIRIKELVGEDYSNLVNSARASNSTTRTGNR